MLEDGFSYNEILSFDSKIPKSDAVNALVAERIGKTVFSVVGDFSSKFL